MEISFTHPHYLFLLFALPVLVFLHFITLKYKRGHALRFANFDAISKIRGIDLYSKNIVILVLTVLIVVLLVLSVSGLTIQRTVTSSYFSFIIAIDSSKSMEANDFSPSRMEASKNTALNFVNSLPSGSRVGVISFSGNSLIEQDVTIDKSLIRKAINDIEISSIGGTDLYESIITSTNLLRSEDARSIIMLSDGQVNVGDLDDAIDYAIKNNVIVHTIAMGTEIGGETSYGFSKLDESSLKAISYNTGGEFFMAKNENEIERSFNEILELKEKKVLFNISHYLIFVSVGLLILKYFLVNTRYRIFP